VPEPFLALNADERREALAVAAGTLRRPVHLLEKDIWVVWTLRTLFTAPFAQNLAFKGGTSLSKAYGAIRRFSEDVDLTYDIRALAPDLVGNAADPIPPSRSQQKKWTDEIRAQLPPWIQQTVVPSVERQLGADGLKARIVQDGDKLTIEYQVVTAHSAYVRPAVLLEFGARSTGEPTEARAVFCDASAALPDLEFPQAMPRVMRAERTFWEKALAMHVYCAQGRFRGGERFSRHWHDLSRLHNVGVAARAIADRALAQLVARHKAAFFAERDSAGEWIDYNRSTAGELHLVPQGDARAALAADYERMVADGLLLDDAEPFDALMAQCATIEELANVPPARES
jgi:Nucleotidyl transferase AbiEii toxin, Type IV TA system